jgi:hypothetical protein
LFVFSTEGPITGPVGYLNLWKSIASEPVRFAVQ